LPEKVTNSNAGAVVAAAACVSAGAENVMTEKTILRMKGFIGPLPPVHGLI
jgi:hypothetical protein